MRQRLDAGRKLVEQIRAYNPTRPVFTHSGGIVGDFQTINMYLLFTPMQERDEWLSHYAQHGELPIMIGELGSSYIASFRRRRYFPARYTEPLPAEHAASFLGTEAYRLETTAFRRELRNKFRSGEKYTDRHDHAYVRHPSVQQLSEGFVTRTWRSWRTWGIPGGMVLWPHHIGWTDTAQTGRQIPLEFTPGLRGGFIASVQQGYLRPTPKECSTHCLPVRHSSKTTNPLSHGSPDTTQTIQARKRASPIAPETTGPRRN